MIPLTRPLWYNLHTLVQGEYKLRIPEAFWQHISEQQLRLHTEAVEKMLFQCRCGSGTGASHIFTHLSLSECGDGTNKNMVRPCLSMVIYDKLERPGSPHPRLDSTGNPNGIDREPQC